MFGWIFKEKDQFTLENERMAKEIHEKILLLNKDNKYKARVVMNYIEKPFSSEESLDDLYEKIYLNKDDLKKMKEILSFESPFNRKWYKHYKGDRYRTIGVALPVKEINGYEDYYQVRHTEDNVNMTVYSCHQFLFHDYNDDVLMIYTNHDEIFARPYEMFFSVVEHEGKVLPRFEKIEE